KEAVNSQPSHTKGYSLITLINDSGVITPVTSLNITSNRITIDKSTLLAKSPSSINKDWIIGGSTGNELLDHHLEPFLTFIGVKRKNDKQVNMLDCILANLCAAINSNSQLLYSRNKSNGDYLNTIRAIDYLESKGLIINVIGKANEYQGNSSWMIPTQKLVAEIEAAKVRVALKKDYSMVIVRDKDGNEKQLSRFKTRQPALLRSLSNPVQDYNAMWLDHSATYLGRYITPFCRRIFNVDLSHGGRFYGGSHLVMPKAERQLIKIDDQDTIEPDFKAMHYCLIYARAGIQLNPLLDDPYSIDGYTRATIKLASLVLLNSSDLARFKANITKSGSPENKAVMAQYEADYKRFIMRSSQGLETKQPVKPKVSEGFISGMPDHIKGDDLLAAILAKHSPIAHFFGSDRIGLKLQLTDSQIMASVISQLAAVNVPLLPIHDSIRVKATDCQAAVRAMKAAYRAITGFEAVVEE
ncbi:hypothetical protein, partial [Shewanella sp.]|uniref:hypothetical protein n=1 Tax=Shewanella sp. TaxID=50422 RepID=UPI003F2B73A7